MIDKKLLCIAVLRSVWHGSSSFVKERKLSLSPRYTSRGQFVVANHVRDPENAAKNSAPTGSPGPPSRDQKIMNECDIAIGRACARCFLHIRSQASVVH